MAVNSIFPAPVPALTRANTRARVAAIETVTPHRASSTGGADGQVQPNGDTLRDTGTRPATSPAAPRLGHPNNNLLLSALITEMGGSGQPVGKGTFIDLKV